MNKTIWVIDDDQGLLEIIQLLFAVEKIKGEFISQPSSIDEMLKTKPEPSLIFLDIYMSGINGIELCQDIKNNPKTQHIPVVLMSADAHIMEKAQQAQADASLQKPFDGEELLNLVHHYLG